MQNFSTWVHSSFFVLGNSKCVLRGRRKDFETLQNTRQAQEFRGVAKSVGRGGFEEGPK